MVSKDRHRIPSSFEIAAASPLRRHASALRQHGPIHRKRSSSTSTALVSSTMDRAAQPEPRQLDKARQLELSRQLEVPVHREA